MFVFVALLLLGAGLTLPIAWAENTQLVTLDNGITAQVSWTPPSQAANAQEISFSIQFNLPPATNVGWFAFGVASSNGLGTNFLTGGPRGGGALVANKVQDAFLVREFTFAPNHAAGGAFSAIPYTTSGLAADDALDCMWTYCQGQSQACLSQKLCRDALLCAERKFPQVPTNMTEDSFDDLLVLFDECIHPLSDPKVEEQSKALSIILTAGSCFTQSCSSKMIEIATRSENLDSTQTSFADNSLEFRLMQRQLASVNFASSGTGEVQTFFVAVGQAFTSQTAPKEDTKLTQPLAWSSITVNLESGALQRVGVPLWLQLHVALAVLGFAVVFALSLCLRRVPMKRMSWIPFALTSLGTAIGCVGVLLVSMLGQKSDANDLHKVLSLLVLVICIFAWLGGIFHSPPASSSGLEDGQSANWTAALSKARHGYMEREGGPMSCLFTPFELVCLVGIALACITGFTTLENSALDPGQMILAVIVACAVCAFSVLCILFLPFFLQLCCRHRKGAANGNNNSKVADLVSSAPNPVFRNMADDAEVGDFAAAAPETTAPVIPLVLAWSNLSFNAPQGKAAGAPKVIFRDAVGICSPRTLTCLVGPSGAGKSSLMDFLSCRNRVAANPESQLTVNGLPIENYPQLHRHMALVPQQDVLHEHLTVLETLQFSCEMILPESMSPQRKVDHMLRIVAQLGMGHVLDSIVGGNEVRGLSGGERRRVSIALQMIKSPSILFLDEPTSGLDAHLALKLCKVLRELANEGRTVFATIHQPSVACFELFDRLILMSAGYTVYSGTRTGVLQFLKECNRDVPSPSWNPADWILTLVDVERSSDGGTAGSKLDQKTEELLKRKRIHSQNREFKMATFDEAMLKADVAALRDGVVRYYDQVNPGKLKEDYGLVEEVVNYTLTRGVDAVETKLKSRYNVSFLPFLANAFGGSNHARNAEPCTKKELVKMVEKFYSSQHHAELKKRIADVKADALTADAKKKRLAESVGDDYAQPFMVQMQLLSSRSFVMVWRNPQALRFQSVQNVVFGLLLGALFSNIKSLNSPFQIGFGMASILAMVAFVALSLGTQIAFNDRLVLEREMSDAMYSPYAHFTQRIVVGVPVAIFVGFCLILPAYFLIGLRMEGDAFFFFFLVNVGVVFVFDSIVFALTLIANNVNTAYAMGNFFEALAVFFSGVSIPVYAMPNFLAWLYFLSPFSYAFGAVVQNEFMGTDNEFLIKIVGVVVQDKWMNLLIVLLMGVMWRLFGLVGIIRLFNRKRPGKGGKAARDGRFRWC